MQLARQVVLVGNYLTWRRAASISWRGGGRAQTLSRCELILRPSIFEILGHRRSICAGRYVAASRQGTREGPLT